MKNATIVFTNWKYEHDFEFISSESKNIVVFVRAVRETQKTNDFYFERCSLHSESKLPVKEDTGLHSIPLSNCFFIFILIVIY